MIRKHPQDIVDITVVRFLSGSVYNNNAQHNPQSML